MLPNSKSAQQFIGYYEGGTRPTGDFYSTPPIAVEKLLSVETFGKTIWEPACGNGVICRTLKDHEVIASDLYDWGYGETGVDFLTYKEDCRS